jgi:hypothetical protein
MSERIESLESLFALAGIHKLNKATYANGEPLTVKEEKFLQEWASKSDANKHKMERYTRKEWLHYGNFLKAAIQRIFNIEGLLFELFVDSFGDAIQENYVYFLLNARYVVEGLSNDELQELKDWAGLSARNQRVFDQFTTKKYAKQSIELVEKFTTPHVYDWFMQKYHPNKTTRKPSFWRIFKKKAG